MTPAQYAELLWIITFFGTLSTILLFFIMACVIKISRRPVK